MPTYQYRCKECGHDFEVVQSFHDDALTGCPECEGALKKVYGNVGISFKGSGFYKTDSRASSGGSSGTSTSSDTGSSDTGSSESGSSESGSSESGSSKSGSTNGSSDSSTSESKASSSSTSSD